MNPRETSAAGFAGTAARLAARYATWGLSAAKATDDGSRSSPRPARTPSDRIVDDPAVPHDPEQRRRADKTTKRPSPFQPVPRDGA